mmetsp:Transcript_9055/g.18695  ORF Transcript_9055/g.18695 Transcript_9055/m.18695 type:complete len:964 (+) Transcript_9055:89-2980(+)
MVTRIIGSHFVLTANRRSCTRSIIIAPSITTTIPFPISRGLPSTSPGSFLSSLTAIPLASSNSSCCNSAEKQKKSNISLRNQIMPSARHLALTSLLGLTGGGVSAFQVSTSSCLSFGTTSNKFFPNSSNRRTPWQVRANSRVSNFDSIRPFSSALVSSMADSIAEKDSTQQQQQSIQSQQQLQNTSQSSPIAKGERSEQVGSATGEVISVLIGSKDGGGNSAGFAVVRVSEEDVAATSPLSAAAATATATNAAAATTEGERRGDGEKEENKVELASALFGKPALKPMGSVAGKKSNNGGVMADGDLTGRAITFANKSKGIVVAHRHPIAFVLLDASASALIDAAPSSNTDKTSTLKGTSCTIFSELVSIDPTSIPPGSTVDYLGRHIAVLNDGSISRSLPKANNSIRSDEVANENDVGIEGICMDISLTVPTTTTTITSEGVPNSEVYQENKRQSSRPIFVTIPKITDIGLIDSPLVTGITMFDALTPIGKGQNMLVIGQEEEDTLDVTSPYDGVNKRGWMMNMLKFVVENDRARQSIHGDRKMRCFYGLTYSDNTVRANFIRRLELAGIQDDVVAVLSTRGGVVGTAEKDDGDGNGIISSERALEAAEAVAVAATACSLGEHHALTTGGDSLVIIDDVTLHKSLWDITTQYLVQIYGVDAVVQADLQGGSSSEMRGYLSGLIQRAARFNRKRGGGSVTLILLSTLPGENEHDAANSGEDEITFDVSDFDGMSEKIKTRIAMLMKTKVPLTPTNLRKIQIPVPKPSQTENAKRLALQHVEDLISMSDGQIWLDDALAKMNRSPPLDPSRSMTRVGVGADTRTCRADAPALRSVVGSLRFEFQQAMDVMESSASHSSASSVASASSGNVKQVQRRDAFLLAMHQKPNQVRKLSHECVALIAASRGHLDQVLRRGGTAGTPDGNEAIEGLIRHAEKEAPGIMSEIDGTLDISLESRNFLEGVIAS